MHAIRYTFWGAAFVLTALWLLAEPAVFGADSAFALRRFMVQYTGVLAIGAMSVAMILALRPRAPEARLGGLDKIYRLHKWLGIGALVVAVIHWLWAQGFKWAVGWGWLARPQRGPRPQAGDAIEATFRSMRHTAESVGEWAFYAAVLLIVLALIRAFPYRWFFKTHRILALSYLVLVFHTVVLLDYAYWRAPVGWVVAGLSAFGTWAAVIVLLRRVGAGRKVQGAIARLDYFSGVRALEVDVEVPDGWPGHKPGQFAFVTSDSSEGAHPYTIASSWDDRNRTIRFIAKELGDHTRHLREKLTLGQAVTIEGPYGCFTFDDDAPRQIWIGGGIGITPFIARMKHLAAHTGATPGQTIDLFHCSADVDETAFAKLKADAEAANVRLHLLIDARDGLLTGDKIRAAVPGWAEASIWFCGPARFGQALRQDFEAHGVPVKRAFHQELFAMR